MELYDRPFRVSKRMRCIIRPLPVHLLDSPSGKCYSLILREYYFVIHGTERNLKDKTIRMGFLHVLFFNEGVYII